MPRSTRLAELVRRLEDLRVRFLPDQFDATGSYSDEVFDQARAYRVLAHAEIEACLEDLGVDTVQAAYRAWQDERQPSTCLLALLAYRETRGVVPGRLAEITVSLGEQLRRARDSYIGRAKGGNHGIRERNVLALLLPVGVLESDIDNTWLRAIDAFGSKRGDTAHQAAGQTQQPPDPEQELLAVDAIIEGLDAIDETLGRLRPDRRTNAAYEALFGVPDSLP